MTQTRRLQIAVIAGWLLGTTATPALAVDIDDAADLGTQQQQERNELFQMKEELDKLRRNMHQSTQEMNKVGAAIQARRQTKEFQLLCKENVWELCPGTFASALTYNGKTPGPELRVQEGDHVRITVQNQMRSSTSLYLHGMILPQSVNGLPRQGAGLIGPGESRTFEFIASNAGTFWYHPQVTHADQMSKGLYGALIVEPRTVPKTWERDVSLIIGQWTVSERIIAPAAGSSQTKGKEAPRPLVPQAAPNSYELFLLNGKSAPAIPPIEVRTGERIRLRVINASREVCPLTLTGHRFEVTAANGSDATEPHTHRDTITVNPGERIDLEFVADNPGVWSLSSMIPSQSSNNGKFPGGIAVVVRYPDAAK